MGAQAKSLEAGTETEIMEEFCLLACSQWLAQFLISYITRTTCPEVAPLEVGYSIPYQNLVKSMPNTHAHRSIQVIPPTPENNNSYLTSTGNDELFFGLQAHPKGGNPFLVLEILMKIP